MVRSETITVEISVDWSSVFKIELNACIIIYHMALEDARSSDKTHRHFRDSVLTFFVLQNLSKVA